MFRRSRLSIRPNVATAGRTAGSLQETSSNTDQGEANTRPETPVSVTVNKSVDPINEHMPSSDQNEESSNASVIQRRKRFSVRPKVVPGRPSALPRTPKSPIKPVLPTVKSPAPVIEKTEPLIDVICTALDQELLTQKECQPTEESSVSQKDAILPSESSSKGIDQPEKIKPSLCSQIKEISAKAPIPPSIPDREATDISERAKTLVSKTALKSPSQHFSLTQLLNDKSDLLRMEKARKLRQLLKQEMLKEKSKKYVARVKEYTLDPSKMTMRDLIHYLPTSNPMLSKAEDSMQDNEAAFPQSPGREISPEREQEQVLQPKLQSPCPGEAPSTTLAEGQQEREEEEADEAAEDEDALMVPQVKVAEDGSLIIDEESLTVEVQRMKGPNPIQDRDPIFERGSTTTYSSFRKGTHTKPWSTEETDMFFLAISMVGTDFAMISQLFPHRARSEIKNKFKKEERDNTWRIDKAFRERRKLDLEYFKKLLEKILEFQQSKKKLKSKTEKPKTSKRKAKSKKAIAELSDVEEENEEDFSIEEQDGEKENLCNKKTKNKRKFKDHLSPKSPANKKKKKREKKHEHKLSDETSRPVDLQEFTFTEGSISLNQSQKTETQVAKPAESKSGKPLPLGRKDQKAKKAKRKKDIVSDEGGETTVEETEALVEKDACVPQQFSRTSDNDSSDHETIVQSAKPSRYGRISKPVQTLNYPAKKETNSSASDSLLSPSRQTSAAKAKNKTNRKRRKSAQQQTEKESKKPRLITLRASQSEGSDDDEEETDGLHYDENSTGAFVPASLCSPKPVIPEVEETMEELDMLAQMPDVLGMSKNALCPDASCAQIHNERGTVEPCEHQLDLLVDVIDFLSEHSEASEDESYNEAAQTLLAIGNLTNPAQSPESQREPSQTISDQLSKFEPSQCDEEEDFSKSSFDKEECTVLPTEPSETETIPTDSTVEEPPTSLSSHTQALKSTEVLSKSEETGSSTHISSPRAKNSLPPRKVRLSKIKPKPNIDSAAKTTKRLSQTIETQSVELEISANSQHQSLTPLEECAPALSEPSKTESRPVEDTTAVPTAPVSTETVSNKQCSKHDNIDSPKLQTTPEPKMNSSPPMRQEHPKVKSNVDYRTKEQTDIAGVEKSQITPEKTKLLPEMSNYQSIINVHGSVAHQEESAEGVSGQDESSSIQETPNLSQLEPSCAKDSSTPRKGRLKLKPKPNLISCASRATKLSSQGDPAIEVKMKAESKMTVTNQVGSSEQLVESTQTVSEQLNCQKEIGDTTTGEMPASQTSTHGTKQSDETSTTEETVATSPLKTPCSKNSLSFMKESPANLHPKPDSASRTAKQSSEMVDTTDESHQTLGESATVGQLQSHVLPLSESEVESGADSQQKSLISKSKRTEADLENRFTLNLSEINGPQEEPSTAKIKSGQFTQMSCSLSNQSATEPLEESRPIENITSVDTEIIPSAKSDSPTAEAKTENIGPVELSNPSSESLKHSTPQRRRWIPKVKPKPNLVSSPRTAKSKEKSQMTDEVAKSSLINTASEPPLLQASTAAKSDEHQSINAELNSASSMPSVLGSGACTNISKVTSRFVTGSNNSVSKTDKIYEDPTIVQGHCELGAENQTNVDHCKLTERVSSGSSKSCKTVQHPELTLRNTELNALDKISTLQSDTSEISAHHLEPAEGAVEPPRETQRGAGPLVGLGQMQTSSLQKSFEYKSLLFPNLPPDEVPSDPDEPFFILSLTEIPVCPSEEQVDPRPESFLALPVTQAQRSNPVELLVPLAAGIDDSLSNIHIPTPEKATFKSSLICVEEYLPSAPSVDISLLEEPRENPSTQRVNLPEAKHSVEHQDSVSAEKRPSIKGDDKKHSKSPILSRKRAPKETDKSENPTPQSESLTPVKSTEFVEIQAQKGSDGPTVMKTKKRQRIKPKAPDEPPWGTETQSSEPPTANVLTRSCTSKDQFTTTASECLDPKPGDSTNALDKEPTNVSEFFFADVFTEVESDCSATANITLGPTQSQPAETKANLRTHSDSPCGQKLMTAPQKQESAAGEATSSNFPDSSATEAPDFSQQENKTSQVRGTGRANRNNKASVEAKTENSRPQRKCKTAKLPEALSQDGLKESTSSSSRAPPQPHETHPQSTLQGSFLEEEPTNVTQYFLSDVFTEVKNDDFSVTAKSNTDSSCSGTKPIQKAETSVNESQKKKSKRKASCDPASGHNSSLTEGQPPDATALNNAPSSIDETAGSCSQGHTTKAKRKGNGQNNAVCVRLRSQRKSVEVLKTSEAVVQKSLEETQSSSAVPPQRQRGPLSRSTVVGKTRRNTKDCQSPSLIQELGVEELHETHKNVDPSQQDSEETRGKGSSNRKNKASDGPTSMLPQPQKQDTKECKATIKDNISASTSMPQTNNQIDSQECSLFDDEPTNVSQYFLTDIFTDVDDEFKS